jgi:hypothetical protein
MISTNLCRSSASRKPQGLRLWVLPFSPRERQLPLPETGELNEFFRSEA